MSAKQHSTVKSKQIMFFITARVYINYYSVVLLITEIEKSYSCTISQRVGKMALDAIPHWLLLFLTIMM